MAEEPCGGIEEVAARTRGEAQVRHEQEQRQHAELVARHGFEEHDAGLDRCRFEPDEHRHRSEEHTSELQSLMRSSYAVFCLKKKKISTKERIRYAKHNV